MELVWPSRRTDNSLANSVQEDKDLTNATVTHDDASSERKLTADPPMDAIHVSKDWMVSRD